MLTFTDLSLGCPSTFFYTLLCVMCSIVYNSLLFVEDRVISSLEVFNFCDISL